MKRHGEVTTSLPVLAERFLSSDWSRTYYTLFLTDRRTHQVLLYFINNIFMTQQHVNHVLQIFPAQGVVPCKVNIKSYLLEEIYKTVKRVAPKPFFLTENLMGS